MEVIVNPKISNYTALKEHFDCLGGDFKIAHELYKDLIFANKNFDIEDKTNQPRFLGDTGITTNAGDENSTACITIPYRKEYFDSGFVFFTYTGTEDKQRVYEFTGTGN